MGNQADWDSDMIVIPGRSQSERTRNLEAIRRKISGLHLRCIPD
jgi:hypothetical protein